MITITWPFFINILQTEYFWAVKFATGLEKHMSFLQKFWKVGLGSFKQI